MPIKALCLPKHAKVYLETLPSNLNYFPKILKMVCPNNFIQVLGSYLNCPSIKINIYIQTVKQPCMDLHFR